MDFFPLYNSIRISLISTFFVFFIGVFFAYYISKLPYALKGFFDCVFTLPLVLPPTVVGYLILLLLGPNRPIGALFLRLFNVKMTMVWYSAIIASFVVSFPLMYRTLRSSFESFDETVTDAAKTLGIGKFHSFWSIRIPYCKEGIIAGSVLTFARALGEYGATSMVSGFIPKRTATISTTVYQLWQTGNDSVAYKWIIINIAISFFMLILMNLFEKKSARRKK